ncbi:TPA: hypothetical protein RFM61_002123 [Klebsiella pneumoniae subsp. pneumoniae]|uniref:hypothetical protein n=1 Tax=Klebsiella pneumoniae TaxID=573 RepID=UPI000D1BE636|nr:hypothetical protein [Klebsiella pneumoniae]HCF8051311.1 hypothetical protein [Klebsiella pneumoniae]HDU3837967.1 hypothetical protein [Klebsiella pneumoniae subsp. pneumoniae]
MSDFKSNRLTGNIIIIFLCVCFIVSTFNHDNTAAAIYALALAVFYGFREISSYLSAIADKTPDDES